MARAGNQRTLADALTYRIPDTSAHRDAYVGRHTVVVGSGHSAVTAVGELARLVKTHPGTRVTWALRRGVSRSTWMVYDTAAE